MLHMLALHALRLLKPGKSHILPKCSGSSCGFSFLRQLSRAILLLVPHSCACCSGLPRQVAVWHFVVGGYAGHQGQGAAWHVGRWWPCRPSRPSAAWHDGRWWPCRPSSPRCCLACWTRISSHLSSALISLSLFSLLPPQLLPCHIIQVNLIIW